MQATVDDAKIEAAIARLDGIPDYGRVAVTDLGFAMRDTGLTVAELREILEAARGQAWRDTETDPPSDDREVIVQRIDGTFVIDRYLGVDTWSLTWNENLLKWRELPR